MMLAHDFARFDMGKQSDYYEVQEFAPRLTSGGQTGNKIWLKKSKCAKSTKNKGK